MDRKKSAIFVCIILVVVCLVIWWKKSVDAPKITVKTRVPVESIPNPNAFDYYLKATKMIVDRGNIDICSRYVNRANKNPANAVPADILATMHTLVSRNHNTLTTLRKGFPYQYKGPDLKSIDQKFPYYGGYRSIARLLSVSAYIKDVDGEYGSAMNDLLDAMDMGGDTPRGGGDLARLVGIACQTIGRAHAWNVVDNLNEKETVEALKRFQRINANNLQLYQTIEQEKDSYMNMLEQFMYLKPGAKPPLVDMSKLRNTDKQYIYNRISDQYDKLIEYTKKPYASTGLATVDMKLGMNPLWWISDKMAMTLSEVIMPDANERVMKYTINETLNALFETTLALRAYKLQNGQYPDHLEQLSTFCQKPVNDPFAVNALLRYKKAANGYKLYSVGPDGSDDLGQPITQTDPNSSRVKIDETSTGDIVAGVMKM